MTKKKKTPIKMKALKRKAAKNYVKVSNTSYGKRLKGIKIYFEGKRPTGLKDDGKITLGKNILEILKRNFTRFDWVITEGKNEIVVKYGITKVYTSSQTLGKLFTQSLERTRDVKEDIITKNFATLYPGRFTTTHAAKYVPGTIAGLLKENILNDLSTEDKDELNKFIPDYAAKESVGVVSVLNATAQIKTLRELAQEMKSEIKGTRSEKWWQDYIHKNILIIQQGYIKAIEKLNISVGTTKLPDFSLVTHDNFLDILEIKMPSTPLIKLDSRNNYRWDSGVSSAIIQTENYIEIISKNGDQVRSFIKDKYGIDLKIVKPRGIILAGDSTKLKIQKERDDFRLLTQASKNITFLTYDELVIRLENFIEVLEKHSAKK